MKISLSDSFSYSKLLRFTFPSIVMMIFTSIYSVVDGFFVSNIVGKTAFAAVNLIFPFIMVLGGMGAMFGVGGSALVAKTLGEGETKKAQRYFTMMIYIMVIVGVVFTVLGIVFMRPVSYLFGATEGMIDECVVYGRTILIFNTAMLAQYTFQSYLIVAEKPKLGLLVTVLAGVTNMVLDYLFMAVFDMGIFGAALATGLSQCVGGIIPLIWFLSKCNKSALRFTKTKIELKPMLKACANGASEMLSSVSGSITGILYNLQLIKYAGEDGVAAYGVVMYAAYVFIAIYMGFCTGSSPIMGYHYGAQNHKEMKNLFKKSMTLLGVGGIILTVTGVLLARPIALVFVSYDKTLLELTARAFAICALPFMIMSINMYTSSLFTALNNGGVSAAISFLRALIFPTISILVLPIFFEIDGVWFSLVGSEILSFIVSIIFLIAYKKKYKYC
ncbi:MAG: MATE family efflux transporter [Clostridia bacterium]|nr:MATE family efflux transporter [Clostridia bacterium]